MDNRVNGATTGSSSLSYTYDGLRLSKTVSGSSSPFVWDVGANLPQLIKDGSVAYVYGPGGHPLEQISGSIVLWLHHDQLGSTRVVTDSTGATQETYSYDAYGNPAGGTGTISNPLQFAGQYRDGDSGLYYLRARYYDPAATVHKTRPCRGEYGSSLRVCGWRSIKRHRSVGALQPQPICPR